MYRASSYSLFTPWPQTQLHDHVTLNATLASLLGVCRRTEFSDISQFKSTTARGRRNSNALTNSSLEYTGTCQCAGRTLDHARRSHDTVFDRFMFVCHPRLTREGTHSPQPGVGCPKASRHLRSKCRCSCVLQFTRRHTVCCVFHRPTSRGIHLTGLCFTFDVSY